VKSLVPILVVLALATAYGLWYQRTRGKVRQSHSALINQGLTSEILGAELGSRGTLVQFSSAFCTPCKATRILLANVVADKSDIQHIEIDAEAHLELVRKLDIRSTPTTLILDSRGMEVGRAIGAPNRQQVVNALSALQ
jgi:thiol-disulfide isomerase/thioredoxin